MKIYKEISKLFIFLKRFKTTSIHSLNADIGLNYPLKKIHSFLNWFNTRFPFSNIDDNLMIRDFICKDLKYYWEKTILSLDASPPRKLSNLFWLCLPWNKIINELHEISILDIGCGSGNYGPKFVSFSNDNIFRYIGIDIYKRNNWKKLKNNFSFFQFYKFDGKNIYNYLKEGVNFITTQSALEHFDEDLSYFYQIRDYIINSKKNVIQIHLFPSRSCLRLYPHHGVRQYTPRTVSKITRLFKNFSYYILFNLGGEACNNLHYESVIKPIKLNRAGIRFHNPYLYDKILFRAIEKDMNYPCTSPSFYALLIHSNWNKKII